MTSIDSSYSATVAANGTATITVTTGARARNWSVHQVSVELASAPIGSTCTLRKNGNLITLLVPNGDAATGDPPIQLNANDQLTIVWTGCTAGTVAKAYLIYNDGRQ